MNYILFSWSLLSPFYRLRKLKLRGNSLVVQWLGLSTFTAGAQVQSLVGELRSCKPHGVAKKKKNKETKAQRGTATFPGLHSKQEAESGSGIRIQEGHMSKLTVPSPG